MTTLFVSNALNGGARRASTRSTTRRCCGSGCESGPGQPPKVISQQVIADGIPWVDSPEALVVGPTGLALASNGTLYVADTLDNRITAIPQALTRTTPAAARRNDGHRRRTPEGTARARAGAQRRHHHDQRAATATWSRRRPAGKQLVAQTADTKTGAGSLFGLVVAPGGNGVYFVDDGENTLRLLH